MRQSWKKPKNTRSHRRISRSPSARSRKRYSITTIPSKAAEAARGEPSPQPGDDGEAGHHHEQQHRHLFGGRCQGRRQSSAYHPAPTVVVGPAGDEAEREDDEETESRVQEH